MDGEADERKAGVGIAFLEPKGDKLQFALKFTFGSSNNEPEYEVMIHGLEMAKDLEIKNLKVYSDSQLIINQIKNEFQEKDEKYRCMPKRHEASSKNSSFER